MSVCLPCHTPSGAAHADVWHRRGGDREARAVRSVRVTARPSDASLEVVVGCLASGLSTSTSNE
eukprot:14049051-Heterocapsa_arctica.AAC.1